MRFGKQVLILVLTAGACLFLLFRAYEEVRSGAMDRLTAQEAILARQAAQGIETLFITYRAMLEGLAADQDLTTLNEDGREHLRAFARANRHTVLSVSRMDEDGRLIFVTPQESASGLDISGQTHVALLLKTRQAVVQRGHRRGAGTPGRGPARAGVPGRGLCRVPGRAVPL